MITRIRREWAAASALLHNRFPAPGTSWAEDVYWLAASLRTRIHHALRPLTEAEQAANDVELLTGTPAPALPQNDAQDSDEQES